MHSINSVYMSIPVSQFNPHTPLPPWRPYVCCLRLCLYFCFVNKIIYTNFFRFHKYALIYDICFSLSDLLHPVWQSLGPSVSLQMPLGPFLQMFSLGLRLSWVHVAARQSVSGSSPHSFPSPRDLCSAWTTLFSHCSLANLCRVHIAPCCHPEADIEDVDTHQLWTHRSGHIGDALSLLKECGSLATGCLTLPTEALVLSPWPRKHDPQTTFRSRKDLFSLSSSLLTLVPKWFLYITAGFLP